MLLATFAGLVLLTDLAVPAALAAPPRLSFADPSGDVALDDPTQPAGASGLDLLEVAVEIKNVPPRNVPSLVISWTLAGPPLERAAVYQLQGLVDGCGDLQARVQMGAVVDFVWESALHQPGLSNQFYVDCGPSDSITHVDSYSEVDGNVVRIWAPLGSFPREARSGAITRLRALSAFSEPMIGLVHAGYFEPSDQASTPTPFRF